MFTKIAIKKIKYRVKRTCQLG